MSAQTQMWLILAVWACVPLLVWRVMAWDRAAIDRHLREQLRKAHGPEVQVSLLRWGEQIGMVKDAPIFDCVDAIVYVEDQSPFHACLHYEGIRPHDAERQAALEVVGPVTKVVVADGLALYAARIQS